jgi:hypothetical protein|tara:strand:+ start:156 stop:488 length:333 start_codon:yes stop_codon:yes gene_type:complete
MARKAQADVNFGVMLDGADYHDIVVCSFQEAKDRANFIETLRVFMNFKFSFEILAQVNMWEIFNVTFIKKNLRHLVNGQVKTSYKSCGATVAGVKFPNKGAVQINFRIEE